MSNYYSVTEYANLTGRDPGNIRRMLISGQLQGEKLGKLWMIPKDTILPADRRVKSGKYHNWRQMVNVSKANPILMKSIKKMAKEIAAIYGDSIEKIVLYGSYARGEQTEESDVDIALFVKENKTAEMHDKMIDLVVDYELDLAVTLSVIPVDYAQYLDWKNTLPFYKNVDKDGIILWTAA